MKWRFILSSCCGKAGSNSEEIKVEPEKPSSKVPPSSSSNDHLSISLPESDLYSFTLAELRLISQNFSASNLLGEGGFGPVYRGFIGNDLRPGLPPQPVAVKLLNLNGAQGHKEWLAEVIFLGKLKHAHLVKLIGYCCEDQQRLLVYEYIPKGSLETYLFTKYKTPLPWSRRMKIALGAAKGLAFLHEAEKPVIYRDFKASNVLLDSDYSAKLSDFGLARHGPEGDDTHISTRILGTPGYAAPEYISTGHLRASCDVYSFGVVLLELLTGRWANEMSGRKKNLVEWVRPMLNNPKKLDLMIDPKLEGKYSKMGTREVASLAYRCLSDNEKERPTMSVAATILEPLEDLDDMSSPTFVYIVPPQNDINP